MNKHPRKEGLNLTKKIVSLLLVVMMFFIIAPSSMVQASTPTVTTNSASYDKGDEIQITGTWFVPNSDLVLQIIFEGTGAQVIATSLVADGSGGFLLSIPSSITTGWTYGAYTIYGGTAAPVGFTLTAGGILTTSPTPPYYEVGMEVTLQGENFLPALADKIVRIWDPATGTMKLYLGTVISSSFSIPFTIGDWTPGVYWGMVDYNSKTVTCAFTVGLGSITISPTNSTKAAGVAETYTVNAFDIYGNPMGTVTATFTVLPTAGVTISGNQVTATLAGDYAVTAHYHGLTAAAALHITYNPDTAISITISPTNSTKVAGVAETYTVNAFDVYGNPMGTVTATFTVLPTAGVTIVGNQVTATLPGDYAVTAHYNGLTAAAALHITSAAVATLVLSPATATNVVGTTHTVTVVARDAYLNPVPSLSVAFAVTGANPGGGSSTTNAQGIAVFTYTGTFVGLDHIQASSPNVPPAPPIFSNIVDKTWTYGALDHFGWATISSPQIATIPFAVTITAYDAMGNVRTDFVGTATLTASNGGVTPATTGAFSAGVWTGSIAVDNPGASVTITAQSGAIIGTSNAFVVDPNTITVTFHLIAGWNQITLPVTPESTDPNVVFAGLPFYSWDAVNGIYLDKDLTVLARGVGYWLKVLVATDYDVTGLPDRGATTTLSLALGWNMIGAPYVADIPWANVTISLGNGIPVSLDTAVANGWIRSSLYNWDGSTYQILASGGNFLNLKGYWISAKVSGLTLIFPNPYP